MTGWIQQRIYIRFCVKFEHSSAETICWFRRPQLWATGGWQLHHDKSFRSCIMSHAGFFHETSNHPDDSAPWQPRFGALWLLTFLKTKITFEREEISGCQWDSGKYNRTDDSDWENCVKYHRVYFEGDWGVIVLCTMFLVTCFFNKCLFFRVHSWILSGQSSHVLNI